MAELIEEIHVRLEIDIDLYRLEKRLRGNEAPSKLSKVEVTIPKNDPKIFRERYLTRQRAQNAEYAGRSAASLEEFAGEY